MTDDRYLHLTDWDKVNLLSGINKIETRLEKLKKKHNIDLKQS